MQVTKQDSKWTENQINCYGVASQCFTFPRRCDFVQQLIVLSNICMKLRARQFLQTVLNEKNSSDRVNIHLVLSFVHFALIRENALSADVLCLGMEKEKFANSFHLPSFERLKTAVH